MADLDRGDELRRHVAWLESAIENANTKSDLASLVRERRITLAELASIPQTSKGSKADELRARREARRSGSDDSSSSSRRGQSRRGSGSNRVG